LAGSRIHGLLANVDVVVADGSHAYSNVYLDAQGRFVAIGMPKR
jgi:hypothetical protein